jgi:uncharacterized membrane protein
LAAVAQVGAGKMRTKEFLERLEHNRIVNAIAEAEKKTSGEIRVFIQHGEIADPVGAARKKFEELGMTATRERNAVLVFIAPRSQKFAVIGDNGIHERCGDKFWEELVARMRAHFAAEKFTDAIANAIHDAGDLLAENFPRRPDDSNELPNAVEEG